MASNDRLVATALVVGALMLAFTLGWRLGGDGQWDAGYRTCVSNQDNDKR